MRPNLQRANNAITALYVMMFGLVVLIALSLYTIYLLSETSLIFRTTEDYNSYLITVGLGFTVYVIIYIVCIVLFIMWFRRAYYNLHLLAKSRLRYSEGMAAGAWFIPIFHLFGPFQIATDLFNVSENILVEQGLMKRQPKFHQVKGWWWGLWIAGGVLGRVSSRLDNTIEQLTLGAVLGIIGAALSIGAAVLAIQMIKNYAEMERLLKTIDAGDQIGSPQLTNDDLLDSGM